MKTTVSPRAAVTEDTHPEDVEVEDNSGAAGSRGPTPPCREHGELSAVEQRTNDGVADGAEERRSSSSTPSSPIEQPLESSQEGQECDNKDRTAAAASTAVRRRPFRQSTAFLVGHRNRLEEEALRVCDFLVHIEQVRTCQGETFPWCCCLVHPGR